MRIKVGTQWHDGEHEPIMLRLTQKDKENIANMDPEAIDIVMFPDTMGNDEINEWMKE